MSKTPSGLMFFSFYLVGSDNAVLLHGPLYETRKKYYKTGRTVRSRGAAYISGMDASFSGVLSKSSLRWILESRGVCLEKVAACRGGYTLTCRSFSGEMTRRDVYSKKHAWLSSTYYAPDGKTPLAELSPVNDKNSIVMKEYSAEGILESVLEACPAALGTRTHSLINSAVGEPKLYASTSEGDYCYCTSEIAAKRNALAKNIADGSFGTAPVWETEEAPAEEFLPEPELPEAQPCPPPPSIPFAGGYSYSGKQNEAGAREGRGRTAQPDGFTAYEGNYKNDQRDGYGIYYYKSGYPCYAGTWEKNCRHGAGVSFRSDLSGIHVGQWANDVPNGMCAIFDAEANLRFFGKIEDGKKQGIGVMYSSSDGSVFVGKWKDNLPVGEGSAFDSDGNLIYTGSWKDGKRNGRGTEFDQSGKIVFSGEWRDGAYFDGVFMP